MTIRLIEEYKKEKCLWNTNLEDYTNKNERTRAADKIAKILNIPHFEGKHVLMKFRNLRNSYCQELKKIAKCLKATESDASVEVYDPKVQWFPLMDSFLRPHLQPMRPIPGKRSRRPRPETPVGDDWATPQTDILAVDYTCSYSDQCSAENDEESNDSGPKRRRLSSASSRDKSLDRRSSSSHTTPSSSDPAPPAPTASRDVYDTFGTYIASLLRSLPPEKALELQPEILNMIVRVGFKKARGKAGKIHDSIVVDSD